MATIGHEVAEQVRPRMTGSLASRLRLPWWQPWSLPPREITRNVLKSIRVHEHMSREAETEIKNSDIGRSRIWTEEGRRK